MLCLIRFLIVVMLCGGVWVLDVGMDVCFGNRFMLVSRLY